MVSGIISLVSKITKPIFIGGKQCTTFQNIFLCVVYCPKLRVLMSGGLFKPLDFSSMSVLSSGSEKSDSSIDPEKRRSIEMWLEYCKYNGINVPENIREKDIQYLVNLNYDEKFQYINYLVVAEHKRKKGKARKERLKKLIKTKKEESNRLQPQHIRYGLWNNTIFSKVQKRSIRDLHNHRLASAVINNQPLILDLSFDSHMKMKESISLAIQLMFSIFCNQENRSPFNLMLYNVDFKSEAMMHLKKILPTFESLPMIISTENYLDLYPKEKLIYLTSDAKNEMTHFDSSAIYIIGGIVDNDPVLPHTLSKAKKERIKVQKFPLDRYHVIRGQKSLAIHVVTAILLDFQNTGDWKKAFENISRR